jgi:hypothetical protein
MMNLPLFDVSEPHSAVDCTPPKCKSSSQITHGFRNAAGITQNRLFAGNVVTVWFVKRLL